MHLFAKQITMIDKLKSIGFTIGHLQIVLIAAVVLAGLAYFQTKTKSPQVFVKEKDGALTQREENSKILEDYTNELAKNEFGIAKENGAVLGNTTNQLDSAGNSEPIPRIQPRGPAVPRTAN